MKKIVCFLVIILNISMSITVAASTSKRSDIAAENIDTAVAEEKNFSQVDINNDFRDDEIIVVMNNSESIKMKIYTTKDFPEISVKSIENLTKSTDDILKMQRKTETLSSEKESTTDENDVYINEENYHRFFLLKLNRRGKENVINGIKLLEQRDDIIFAMPNYYKEMEFINESATSVDELRSNIYSITPNDYFDSDIQWGIERIDLPNAWMKTTGDNTVIVGVMDSGIMSNHEDLSANIAPDGYHVNCTSESAGALSDVGGHGTQVAEVLGVVPPT